MGLSYILMLTAFYVDNARTYPVEGTPTAGFLGLANGSRDSDHHVRNVEASPDASAKFGGLRTGCEERLILPPIDNRIT
jgi:hypothetical protein